jgi:hypothetical protein
MIQLSTIGWILIWITWVIGFIAIVGCIILYKQVRLHSMIGSMIMYHLHKRNRSYTQLLRELEGCYGCTIDDVLRIMNESGMSSNSVGRVTEMIHPDNPDGGSDVSTDKK